MSNPTSSNSAKRYIRWDLGNPKPSNKFNEEEFEGNYFELEEARDRNKSNVQISMNQMEDDSRIIFPDRHIWIGSLNFPVMKSHYDKINSINGVEVFKVPGTYTILVGVGVLFNDDKVKKCIELALNAECLSNL